MDRSEENERLEAIAMMRNGVAELSHEIARDQRKGMELLEEQIYGMGSSCPQELIDAYDSLAKAARETSRMFDSVEEDLAGWD